MSLAEFTPENYTQLLAEKACQLRLKLQPFYQGDLTIFASNIESFRQRVELRFWHDNLDAYYVMFDKNDNKKLIRIDDLPIASQIIRSAMVKLRALILEEPVLKERLFQVEFLSSLSGQLLITLIYHKALDDTWCEKARLLETRLNCHIIGRSRKQKLVLSQDYIDESLQVNGKTFYYRQAENSFTQPNALMNQHMLSWAQESVNSPQNHDLLELYCGHGNFTIALSAYFKQVLATEISKSSVHAAQFNLAKNAITNSQIIRMSSEDFTKALNKEREFQRLKESAVNLEHYHFSTVLVDPPRAGLDENTLQLISQFDQILYISCNPDSLCDNLNTLCQTHQVKKAALFDQFPYTHHVETGVLLQKINNW